MSWSISKSGVPALVINEVFGTIDPSAKSFTDDQQAQKDAHAALFERSKQAVIAEIVAAETAGADDITLSWSGNAGGSSTSYSVYVGWTVPDPATATKKIEATQLAQVAENQPAVNQTSDSETAATAV